MLKMVHNFLLSGYEKAKFEAGNGNFSLLDELHHFAAGLKALSTDYAYEGIDKLRLACGGAGFTMASGIADTWSKC
jgi:acyl-CoA oxidase